MNRYIIFILTGILAFACSDKKSSDQANEEKSSSLIQLTSQQMEYNGIETGNMPRGVVYHKIKATGKVEVPPNHSIALSAPMDAYVANLKVLPGDHVAKGEIVAQLRHPGIAQVQKDYLSTKSAYDYMQKELKRKNQLLDGNTVSAREYELLTSDMEVKSAELSALSAELIRLGISPQSLTSDKVTQYLSVRAPISGVVTESFKQSGEYVAVNEVFMKVLNHEHVHVEVQIFQQDLPRVKQGMNVLLKVPGNDMQYTGKVTLVNTQLDPETLSANIHVHPEESFPEAAVNSVVFSEVIFQVDSGYVLPKSEVMRQGAAHFIFVKRADGFDRVEVKAGFDDGDNIQIMGPVELFKSQVVTKGNYYLNGGA